MARQHALTRREKTLAVITAIVVVGAGAYFGFLEDFVTRYRTVRQELQSAGEELNRQRETLREGPRVDAEFAEIEGSLSKPRPGKSLDMAFSEDMENLFRTLGLPTPQLGKDSVEEVPKTAGFSYLTLPILDIRTDLPDLSKLLKSFVERNLLIRKLRIASLGSGVATRRLQATIEVAQVIRTEEVSKARTTRGGPVESTEE